MVSGWMCLTCILNTRRCPTTRPNWACAGLTVSTIIYDQNQPEMMPLLAEIRALLDAYPERYAIGETFESFDNPEGAAQYCGEGKLHAAFSFEFTKSRWRAADFLRAIQRWENALPDDAWPNYVLNNHDVIRTATRFGKGESDERLKVAAALLLTQRGTPYLYYGEEIGMRDIKGAAERDPGPDWKALLAVL